MDVSMTPRVWKHPLTLLGPRTALFSTTTGLEEDYPIQPLRHGISPACVLVLN